LARGGAPDFRPHHESFLHCIVQVPYLLRGPYNLWGFISKPPTSSLQAAKIRIVQRLGLRKMSDQQASRFAPQNKTTNERLSTHTVGLVALSDFRKRRAEVLEQQEREAREAALSRTNASTPDRSQNATPNNASDNSEAERQKKKKKRSKALVSFGGDEEEGEDQDAELTTARRAGDNSGKRRSAEENAQGEPNAGSGGVPRDSKDPEPSVKVSANASVAVVPRALTKAALRREAAEREALRKEFLLLQAAVKATEIAIPFVFYDGTNLPGGMVRVKKGDFAWVFLDKARKVGAELGVGGEKSATTRRDWARVGVDDLMLVRGTLIIPHVSSTSTSPTTNCTIDIC
jgi:protein FAM50